VSFLLGGFTLLAGVIFHRNLSDEQHLIHFLKNVSIAYGAGPLSVDR